MKPPIPDSEIDRLAALKRYRILDTAPEAAFDDITRLAAFISGAPISLMTLIDRERQWFKSSLGLSLAQTPREDAFCAYTILQADVMVIEDALQDERFAQHPLVLGDPNIRFYAGAPLLTPEGHALGSVCVIDREPRQLTAAQKAALESLARMVITTLELRRVSSELAEAASNIKALSGLLPICSYCKEIRNDNGYWEQVEAYVQTHTDATFSHAICPKCTAKYLEELGLGAHPGKSPR
jgi:GAF domain-containing protein